MALLLMLQVPLAVAAESTAKEPKSPRITDATIAQAVNGDLWSDEGVSADLVDVSAVNGIVTLSGSVDNLLAKKRAVRIAKSIRGVRAVINELEVRPVVRSDSEIRSDVLSALARDPATDPYEVTVAVSKGVATLRGQVDSWQEKQLAASVAEGVRGVTAVKNDIRWEWTPGRPDAQIRTDIQQRLNSDIWIGNNAIDVKVTDGKVKLGGTVGSAIEKAYASTDAWVSGVKSVDDSTLEVVPWMNDANRRPRRYAYQSDQQIDKAARAAFDLDPRLKGDRVSVAAADGVVTLTGRVDSLQARQAAEQDVDNTLGVLEVDNWLKVRPANVPTDAAIAGDIREALKASPYLGAQESIRVRVVNQEAWLNGAVESRFQKRTAGALASAVKGVVSVHNDLAVTEYPANYYGNAPQSTPSWDYFSSDHPRPYWFGKKPTASDALLKKKVKSQLFWSPFVDSGDVRVTVADGVVTLLGNVHSRMERGAAVDNAYQAGATMVIDDLNLYTKSGS